MAEDEPRPGEVWLERMIREEPAAREKWPAGAIYGEGPETDANLFYTDLLAGPNEAVPDPMAGWTPDTTALTSDQPPPTVEPEDPADIAVARPEAARLARHVELPIEEFIGIFGLEWHPNQHIDTLGMADMFEPDPTGWSVLGHPARLMARDAPDGLELAVPVGKWQSTHHLALLPRDVVLLQFAEVRRPATLDAVSLLIKRRNRTFRTCRYCRNSTPPELRESATCCYPCAEIIWPRVY